MGADTIAAVATPPGVGGVGILRLSGPGIPEMAAEIIGRLPEPRHATFVRFRAADGDFIDEGIALFFPAPASFTGEHVLELQGHGGPVVMDLLLRRCLELGARLARPGEFSERAFLNGKLDLAQAEAIADLIEGSTALAVRLAGRSLQGVFSLRINALIARLIEFRVYVEATLDFPEEEIDFLADSTVLDDLKALIDSTREILVEAHHGQVIREGLAVVIAGSPNVGKSSLLNRLSGDETAIVTDIPGTTRDLLKIDVQVDGLPIRIVDTAGMRDSHDPVEQEGVRRARDAVHRADLVLWVYDANQGPDEATPASFPPDVPVTRIRNKIDLLGEEPRMTDLPGGPEIALSVRDDQGVDLLRAHLRERAGLTASTEGAFLARRRHVDALTRGQTHLETARANLVGTLGPELVAEELQLAQQAFGEITGQFSSDDLLGRIFSSFCIGK
ncbi:tRNA uridine-5-carboxymethylaminomethyl(34) synthesis GTPase MnmE [Thiorhodococcus minor]|uniref:tRNA modification GTPase MnmE n=1 Tax=Thiorhodococcus minor TaxID=57489 RepID=A0A6M0K101_9GAMM|nr:tRNA uridine-5-carboxymethylaminomethyl(34) synthesis GTPase MnmE [Thiorhodococcus minor]NEV63446.1 tRNA uridine-5-carboxymethylaminomethyl(34) synthesis GTPase MnmE [Thiorhodococcus minor]